MTDPAVLAAVFGLLAAVAWGLGDFWSARATKILGPITALFYVNLVGLAAYAVVYLVMRPHITITSTGLMYTLLSAVFLTLAATLFYKSLHAGPVSLVSPISSAYPLISTLLALALFKAQLSILQAVAIFIVVLGVMAASEMFTKKNVERRIGRGPLLAFAAAFFYGIGFTCEAQAVASMGWQLPLLICEAASLPLLLLPLIKGDESILSHARRALSNKSLIGASLLSIAALVMLNLGFAHDAAAGAITIAVSACYPALTMALALRHFKENMTLVPLLGALATIAGVVLLTVA